MLELANHVPATNGLVFAGDVVPSTCVGALATGAYRIRNVREKEASVLESTDAADFALAFGCLNAWQRERYQGTG